MMTVQTDYDEIVSKPGQQLKEELSGEEVELKKMSIHTARGEQ